MSDVKKIEQRELTYTERATWGECPVCHAPHGQACDNQVGIAVGRTINGKPAVDGVHIARLRAAPTVAVTEYR